MSDRLLYVDPSVLEAIADKTVEWGEEPHLMVSKSDVLSMVQGILTEKEYTLFMDLYFNHRSYKSIAKTWGCTYRNIIYHEHMLHKKVKRIIDTEHNRCNLDNILDLLTPMQQELVEHAMLYKTPTEIAEALGVSRQTVYNVVRSLANDDLNAIIRS